MNTFRKIIFISLVLTIFGPSAFCADATLVVANGDEYSEKARKRMYDGGPDEEDLKVQEELVAPLRTVNIRGIQKSIMDDAVKSMEPHKENQDSEH